MKEIIKQLTEFIDTYIDGTAIESITYKDGVWTIKYNYDVDDDEFDSIKEMIEFLDGNTN